MLACLGAVLNSGRVDCEYKNKFGLNAAQSVPATRPLFDTRNYLARKSVQENSNNYIPMVHSIGQELKTRKIEFSVEPMKAPVTQIPMRTNIPPFHPQLAPAGPQLATPPSKAMQSKPRGPKTEQFVQGFNPRRRPLGKRKREDVGFIDKRKKPEVLE